jgi:hypothetical protein
VHADRPPKFLDWPDHEPGAPGYCEWRRGWITQWIRLLRDRLRHARLLCDDWPRICDSLSTTVELGTVAIFLDPPYGAEAGRCKDLYGYDSLTVAADVREFCKVWGAVQDVRIVLCGMIGEGHEILEQEYGWRSMGWNNNRGYANRTPEGKERAQRERLWLSPHCLPVPSST